MPSSIEWTDETWNPVTGCSRVSPGCDNCYMFALYPRLKAMRVPGYDARADIVQLQRDRLSLPLSWSKPRRVFVNSMSDAFHQDIPDEYLLSMFQVMKQSIDRAGHVFQVLTKRPGRAVAWWQRHRILLPRRMAREHLAWDFRRESEVRAPPYGARTCASAGSLCIS